MQSLDPRQRPPEAIRAVYKMYHKMKPADLDTNPDILDLKPDSQTSLPEKVHIVNELQTQHLNNAFRTFAGDAQAAQAELQSSASPISVYEHDDMPGLHIMPSLLPPKVQSILLSRLLHRHLSNPTHLTNIHTHYNLSYPPSSPSTSSSSSFFSHSPSSSSIVATPLDPTIHKPLTVSQLLNKKLRWTTLGGQYDWTAKRYPDSAPPDFPTDIKTLLEDIFPSTKAEAAIVNLYSPGDTLSVHRDVAESSSHGLVSISLGCDAIFVIGCEDRVLALRLPSGGAVYMSGEARFAWHGVPQIVRGTCPDYLVDWPGGDEGETAFEDWRAWMAGKRVNLNVRQMWG
ncbi:oxidoreductase [Phaeosphaeria sp. MPI-PUGE-AT-0046c]|nr:oxidoreductase [Phaeosphaeria sp. MPI-PUGE-AT-0046c]